MADGAPNYGWKLSGISGNRNLIRFYTRESTDAPALRPRLVIKYSSPE